MNKFNNIADQALGPLLKEFGYALADRSDPVCVFRSPACELIVGYDSGRGFEVYVALANRNEVDGPPFSSDEIFKACSVPADELPDGYSRPHAHGQRELLEQIRDLLSRYCRPLLAADDAAWALLARQRDTGAAIHQENNRLQQAQSLAGAAWQQKDYARFIEHLSPYRSLLRNVDRARLEYAARKLEGNTAPK